MENLILIFARPPQLGKVKTRLAATLGEEKALRIYNFLLEKTLTEAQKVKEADKAVFSPEESDFSAKYGFLFQLQSGQDLGEKMQNAFLWAFAQGYKRVIIIGSDCYDLDENGLNSAFQLLEKAEVVVGKATDGGYYLLGMKQLYKNLFSDKRWSTDSVFSDTIADLQRLGLHYELLPPLSDVDVESDLGDWAQNLV